MPLDSYTEHPATTALQPVFFNAYSNKSYLGIYEAISKHADALNQGHGHFFGLTQNAALHLIVIGICKIYDRDDRTHSITTVFDYFKSNFSKEHISRLAPDMLCKLRMPNTDAKALTTAFENEDNFKNVTNKLIESIRNALLSEKDHSTLKTLFTYRSKFVAHQEKVGLEVKKQFENLPPLEDIERINDAAYNFCQFVQKVFTGAEIIPSVKSAHTATCNVIKKVLDKNFEDPTKTDAQNFLEAEDFYKR